MGAQLRRAGWRRGSGRDFLAEVPFGSLKWKCPLCPLMLESRWPCIGRAARNRGRQLPWGVLAPGSDVVLAVASVARHSQGGVGLCIIPWRDWGRGFGGTTRHLLCAHFNQMQRGDCIFCALLRVFCMLFQNFRKHAFSRIFL